VKLTRDETEVDDVSDCRDKNTCAFLQKPSGDKIRIRLLVRTIRQNTEDFRFRSRCEKAEIRRYCRRKGSVWTQCSGVARKRQMVGYFVCEEGSKAVRERQRERYLE